jgi:transcription elongation GreA/GreB family factor
LVKLSRNSDAIKQIVESSGIGKTVGKNLENAESNTETIQPVITSTASFERLKAELDNMINVLIPANREDIKIARAHGDFKENSEYDAAKERRNFLSNRRADLERGFMTIQPFDFNTIKISDTVEVGSKVTLTYDDNSEEVFYILGAWDGDPDKNYISYKTPFGAGLMNEKVGAKVTLSDGKDATIKAVDSLPKELLAELTA